jgi:hypothetical protein
MLTFTIFSNTIPQEKTFYEMTINFNDNYIATVDCVEDYLEDFEDLLTDRTPCIVYGLYEITT